MSANFNIAMVLRADVASAKAALKDVTTGLKEVEGAAGRTKAAVRQEAAELEALAAAAAKASLSADELAAAEKRRQTAQMLTMHGPVAQIGVGAFMPVLRAADTAAASLQSTVTGLSASIGTQAHEFVEAAQGARAWQSALDDVRASFNPLFAASRQYEQELERIADAEKLGAISAREAAAARERAAARMAPVNLGSARPVGGGAPGTHITGNLASQGNDIVMMAMAGQNPLQLALQQGTQVAQVFNGLEKGTSITKALVGGFTAMLNPVSLATIGIIAFGTFGVQALSKLLPQAKSFDGALKDLSSSVDAYDRHLKVARGSTSELVAQFGSATAAAQGLAAAMADIDRRRAVRGATEAVDALQKERGLWLPDPAWRKDSPDTDTNAQLFEARRAKDRRRLRDTFGLDGSGQSNAVIDPVLDAMAGADRAKDIDAQIAAVNQLKAAWMAAAAAKGGMSKEEDDFLAKIIAAGQELNRLKAIDENAAGKEAARQMNADLTRQAALQATIATYGKDSVEARRLEVAQQKVLTAEKLRGMGFDSQSAQFRQAMAAIDATAAARETAEAGERKRVQMDKLHDLALERELIGATAAERTRALAVAQAEKDIVAQSLSGDAARLELARARARAEEEIGLAQARSARERQLAATMDAIDAQVGLARDPVTRAALEAEREYARIMNDSKDAERAAAEAARVRAKGITEAVNAGRVQAADLMDEVGVRQQVAAQVAAGTLLASDANRAIREELALRPLVAAAARAEGEEKARLLAVIGALQLAQVAMAAEERREAQNDYLRGAAERVQQARLELALVGQTAAVRARVLAAVQAERDIREQGLTGDAADWTRRNAQELSGLNRQIEAQADAWKTVQGAGEAAIDGVLDKLQGGDIKGAFAGLLDDLNKGFFELAVKNPLKNMIFGSNLGTLDDVGGLQGIWDRMTGHAPLDERAATAAAARPVQAMQIAAAQVTINASALNLPAGAQGLLAGLPGAGGIGGTGAANINAAPLAGGKTGVARQIWDFFSAKGLAPHQVAAILGHAGAESGFNPLATGDGGAAKGLFQWNSRRPALYDFIGGPGNLGDIQKQLQFMWHEFQTSENGSFRRLMAAPDLKGATWAMQGFERPSGYKAGVFGSGQDWEKRLTGAQQSLATFGTAAQAAAGPLGQVGTTAQATSGQMGELGQGMGQFGGALQQILGAAVSGDKGGILGGLISLGGQWLTSQLPAAGFASGGHTGGSDPSRVAGVVHEQEFVFSAPAVRRIGAGNLEALHRGSLRGFRGGGYVTRAAGGAPGQGAAAGGGGVTFAPSFDLRGATDPAETRRQAMRGMQEALKGYDRTMPRRLREISRDSKAI